MCGKNSLIVVESLNEVVTVPCIGYTVENFGIVISLGERKRAGPLSSYGFFKMLDSFKFTGRELFGSKRPWFKEDIKLVKDIKKLQMKLLFFDIPRLGSIPHRNSFPYFAKLLG